MRIIGEKGLTPKKFKEMYHNLFVTIGEESDEEGLDFVFKDIEGIKMRKYLMAAYWPSDKERRKELEEATDKKSKKRKAKIKQHRENYLAPRNGLRRAWEKEIGVDNDKETRIALQRAYDGKGWPEDYEWALTIAVDVGKCRATKEALQVFADKYFGIDCSGFVNAYFQKKGKLTGGDSLLISAYARRTARERLRDVARDDCLIMMREDGGIKTGPGHIMLVEGRTAGADPDGKNDVLQVVESTGGKGLNESNYRRIEDKKVGTGKAKFRMFLMDRGIPGKGNMWVKIVKPF